MLKDTHHNQERNSNLVQQIKNCESSMLETIYSANYFKTEYYILQNSGSKEDAKDIYQQAFTIRWRNVQNNRFSPATQDEVAAYLYRVAKNKWIDHLRSGYRTKTIHTNLTSENVKDDEAVNTADDEKIALIKKAFEKLGESCRELLTGFYYKKMSMKKIAEKMGWTDATARNNKYRCVEKLRELLNKEK